MPDDLFVYGSLRSEFDNPWAGRLRAEGERICAATVRGSVFRVGRYPGYRREPDGIVHGELWRLRDPETTLAALDSYEGDEYARVAVELESPAGQAWIYLYRGETRTEQRIESGDFVNP